MRGPLGAHTMTTYTSDTSCMWDYHQRAEGQQPRLVSERIPCECVGDRLYLVVCDTCETHWIDGDWNTVVEAWHDHAFPGWRELPIIPGKLRGQTGTAKMTPKHQEWFEANYPTAFRVQGAPVLTDRGGMGTRHVPATAPTAASTLRSSGDDRDPRRPKNPGQLAAEDVEGAGDTIAHRGRRALPCLGNASVSAWSRAAYRSSRSASLSAFVVRRRRAPNARSTAVSSTACASRRREGIASGL